MAYDDEEEQAVPEEAYNENEYGGEEDYGGASDYGVTDNKDAHMTEAEARGTKEERDAEGKRIDSKQLGNSATTETNTNEGGSASPANMARSAMKRGLIKAVPWGPIALAVIYTGQFLMGDERNPMKRFSTAMKSIAPVVPAVPATPAT